MEFGLMPHHSSFIVLYKRCVSDLHRQPNNELHNLRTLTTKEAEWRLETKKKKEKKKQQQQQACDASADMCCKSRVSHTRPGALFLKSVGQVDVRGYLL